MTTQYWQRTPVVTTYKGRALPQSNLYKLADVSGNLIQDIDGNQILVIGDFFVETTQYSGRIVP